ncbi:polysaccharide lyase family 1 protein [Stutzerimonas urumqiensis]|uniref:pectate lyase family protein n=1 Tax=Stutzerimonas urumqiensis TaxID=638269 RepID=UPI003BAA6362
MPHVASVLALSLSLGLTSAAVAASSGAGGRIPLERQTLPARDGFASMGGGTTGGAYATPERVYDVTTRAQLKAALDEAGDEPKIIRVHGTLLGNADDAGNPLSCDDYARGTGYSLESYLAAYDPAVWGWDTEPSGGPEEARRQAAEKQRSTMVIQVPSNTTIIGVNPEASLIGLSLRIDGERNVIVRNLNHKAVSDCFPQWDPTDGSAGNWNSEYDMVQIINGSSNVWIDHNHYTDDPNYDDQAPRYFGRPFQQHDGSVDITYGSDLVTVSYNRFVDRDKLMLIGSTDSPSAGDPGKLRVTIHHNEFINIGQRAPRLRWGQADVYNNHFIRNDDARVSFGYVFGVGYDSHIWAEANAFTFSPSVDATRIIKHWKGQAITTLDNVINRRKVDLLAAYNANASDELQLVRDTSWQPTLRTRVYPAQAIPALLKRKAGPVLRLDRPGRPPRG